MKRRWIPDLRTLSRACPERRSSPSLPRKAGAQCRCFKCTRSHDSSPSSPFQERRRRAHCVVRVASARWLVHGPALPNDFFPAHDLTHYAVETVLRFRRAFYGLVCEGWDFTDFGTLWPRGRMPGDEAGPAELIVGFLDIERNTGQCRNADALMERLRSEGCHLVITDQQLDRIRQTRDTLIAQWRSLAAGQTLELEFTPERLAARP